MSTPPPPAPTPPAPSHRPAGDQTVFVRVARVIERIRPAVQADGGDLELVDVSDDGIVKIRFHGACVGCPSSAMTLRLGIERNVLEHVPEITRVEAVD